MSNGISIYFRLKNGTSVSCSKTVSVFFTKNRYLPYTSLNASVICSLAAYDILQVHCYIGNKLIHDGPCEYAVREIKNGRSVLTFRSRGYSAMLAQNEPVPGMNYNMDLTKLGRINTRIPNVTYESGTDEVNYIYVKERSTIWDAVGAYAIKAYGTQPFIYGTNTVRVTKPAASHITVSAEKLISAGDSADRRSILSTAYLADLNGDYVYSLTSPTAEDLGIIRERYYPFDRQWADQPDEGLLQKLLVFGRRCASRFIRYIGYSGEDLFDVYTAQDPGSTLSGEVHEIEIKAEKGRIETTLRTFEEPEVAAAE